MLGGVRDGLHSIKDFLLSGEISYKERFSKPMCIKLEPISVLIEFTWEFL